MTKSIFEYYQPQKVFEEAKATIKRNFDLDLTLIEQVRLKQYVIPILEERSKVTSFWEHFDPTAEAVTRFMVDYYGLPPAVANIEMTNPGPEFRITMKKGFWETSEEFKQYLRRKQEQYHLP